MHLSHSLARWIQEVNIDKYHNLNPECLLGLTVFEKMQCQNNTDNQIMINEGNKLLSPSFITWPPHRGGGGKNDTEENFFARFARSLIFCPPSLAKNYRSPQFCPIKILNKINLIATDNFGKLTKTT